ncbi:hypothetical protein LJJ21_004755 [Salmonella enterica]|nr:hypothetical protein [Salmonella enterica]
MCELLDRLAFDCPWRRDGKFRRPPGKYDPKCGARFPDLEGYPRPPDLPPGMGALRVIEGGKAAQPVAEGEKDTGT